MNTKELIHILSVECQVTKGEAKSVIDMLSEIVKKAVANGEEVSIGSLGKIVNVKRKPRSAFNPRTGEEIEVPEKCVPKFKPSKSFKQVVRGE